jgi:hypothetical protein
MAIDVLPTDVTSVYNHAAKHLARTQPEPRHNYFGHLTAPNRGRFSEGWRFPVVAPFFDPARKRAILEWNIVTFIYRTDDDQPAPQTVAVVGDMEGSRRPLPLHRVEQSRYWATTVRLPTRRVFDYLFLVDQVPTLDPVNTRVRPSDRRHFPRPDRSDEQWSYFWTDYCAEALTFESWEQVLLQRLTSHILPFNSLESRIFLGNLDPSKAGASGGKAYRLDLEMGVVNFIDKLLAGAEQHQRSGYKTCLAQINSLLRQRNPYQEPREVPEEMYVQLYQDLATNQIAGWDFSAYSNPSYFLKLLRRHTLMGAFSHPKYGGNSACYAWDYLAERFPPFNWRQALEQPWGSNPDYCG